jgi:hypothetical protein
MNTIVIVCFIGLPITAVLVFAAWIGRSRAATPDERAKYWDVFLKALAALVAASGGSIAVLKYLDDRDRFERQQFAQREEELLRTMERDSRDQVEQMTRLYDRLGKVVAGLLRDRSHGTPEGLAALTEFDELYWFGLIGVENREVEEKMVILRKLLHGEPPADEAELQSAILALSRACKSQVDAERAHLRAEVEARRRALAAPQEG